MREQLAAARRLCLDTNALIYHLHRTEPYFGVIEKMFHSVRIGRCEFAISVVTELELMVKPIRENDRLEAERVRMVLDAPRVHLVGVDRVIARQAAEVRADTGLDLADAVIVATGLATACDVIVGNDARCARRVTSIPYVFLDEMVKEQQP